MDGEVLGGIRSAWLRGALDRRPCRGRARRSRGDAGRAGARPGAPPRGVVAAAQRVGRPTRCTWPSPADSAVRWSPSTVASPRRRVSGSRWWCRVAARAPRSCDVGYRSDRGRGRRMTDLPTGTVTFLFTDLEGSTRLWEQHPDAMRDALARHDEILRSAVETRDGHVIKTTGDGLHGRRSRPRPTASRAAIDAQRALGPRSVAAPEPLRVRMGLHTGDAEIRDGDYYGTAVNRAARISAAAHGGQIVCSARDRRSRARRSRPDVTLTDLGRAPPAGPRPARADAPDLRRRARERVPEAADARPTRRTFRCS